VYEAVLRDAVQEESGVEVRGGVAADGIVLNENGAVPTVVGVHTDAKEVVVADLVVDSTGRRSPLARWFGEVGLAAPPATTQECGFHYFSRFYRLRDGTEFPSTDSPIASRLDYVTALAFPGDNRTFSLALAVSAADPCRRRLREPEIFDRVLAAFEVTAPWIDAGEPITDVHTMARIENRWQRLVDDTGRPLVGGLVLVGDSSLHTNPTFGRGVSLAFAQAQELACTVEEAVVDPIGYVARFEAWTAEHLGVWFETQVAADAARLDQLAAGLRGEKPPRPTNPNMKIFAGLFALAPRDDIVARALGRLINLLITPMELAEDRDVMTRVSTFLEGRPELPAPQSQGPTRAEFVALAS